MRNNTVILLTTIMAMAIAFLGGYSLNESDARAEIATNNNPFTSPCLDEGANGCYWDAQRTGNGIGSSYVVTDKGQVFRFDPSVSTDSKRAFDH